jgi:hypothetical protein
MKKRSFFKNCAVLSLACTVFGTGLMLQKFLKHEASRKASSETFPKIKTKELPQAFKPLKANQVEESLLEKESRKLFQKSLELKEEGQLRNWISEFDIWLEKSGLIAKANANGLSSEGRKILSNALAHRDSISVKLSSIVLERIETK